GRCIQKPYTDNYDDYIHDQTERYDNGELYKIDSTQLSDSLKFKTPKGKVVYGGGGIMPDIFVPLDTMGASWFYTELRYSSVFTTFAFKFVQGKRNKWNSPKSYNAQFNLTDEVLNQFTQFAEKEYDIVASQADFKRSKKLIA